MRILLSNDDGYFAPGLERLAAELASHAEITVVAPERDRSGASNSLTLDRPLTVRRAPNGFLFVNGTPTDCVHLAVTGLLDELPDMVISGINLGANMGDDTIYSGTVAAATEGYLLGIPSIAVSLASKDGPSFRHRRPDRRASSSSGNARSRSGAGCSTSTFPTCRNRRYSGLRVTRLGKRHKAESVIKTQTPRGETCYWVGAAGAAADAGEGTDFHAVDEGFVSVTPLQIDLTHHSEMPRERLAGRAHVVDRRARMIAGVEKFDGIGMTSARTRARMVERLREQGIVDEAVLSAMGAVPRHIFVEEALAIRAYEDCSAADRRRTDDFAAVRRRAHDRAAARGQPSAPRARDRHRLRLPDRDPRAARRRGVHGRAHRDARGQGAAQPARAQAQQRAHQARRRLDESRRGPRGRRRHRHRCGARGPDARCCAISKSAVAWCCRSRGATTRSAACSCLTVIDKTPDGIREQTYDAVRFVPLLPDSHDGRRRAPRAVVPWLMVVRGAARRAAA